MKNNWISVKDKLPEHEQSVLYYFEHAGAHTGKYDANEDMFYGPRGFLKGDVSHWQPLEHPE